MDKFECGGYFFSSNFDSGNLGRVEQVCLIDGKVNSDNCINAEFNLWTKPDCGGTQYENTNRTWFYFGICGGEPFNNVKFNIMNLNKQAKLYSQGMYPVFKIGPKGKWSRIKEKPSYLIKDENFTVSFLHTNLDTVNQTFYYAFTFPYTYTELQTFLDKLDGQFLLKIIDLKINLCKKAEIEKSKKKSDEDVETILFINKEIENYQSIITQASKIATEENFNEISKTNIDVESDIIRLDAINDEHLLDNYVTNNIVDDIYYYRELLINSIEGRRIDLITISSFHGIQNVKEERLLHLFPDKSQPRCNTFKNKKIIFLSSRVHPGETPASFVLNGFINLLLDRKSIVAATLRKMYVFKIVPFLNPDGVYNGLYRSDTLGHNLNRVYLNPNLETQPSIYAARKILRFYHFGYDKVDIPESFDLIQNTTNISESILTSQHSSSICLNLDNINTATINDSENNNDKNAITIKTNIISSGIAYKLKEVNKIKVNQSENITKIIDYEVTIKDKPEKKTTSKQIEENDKNMDSTKSIILNETLFYDIIESSSSYETPTHNLCLTPSSSCDELKNASNKELLFQSTNSNNANVTKSEETSKLSNKLLLNFGGKIWCQNCVNGLLYKSLENRLPGITKILAQTIDTIDNQLTDNKKCCCNCGLNESELYEKCNNATAQSSSADEELEACMSKSSLSSSGDDIKESSPPLEIQSLTKNFEKTDGKIFTDKLVQEIKPVVTTGPALRNAPTSLIKSRTNSGNVIKKTILETQDKKFSAKSNSGKQGESKLKDSDKDRQNLNKKSPVKRDIISKTRSPPPPIYGSFKNSRKNHNKNISSEFLQMFNENEDIYDSKCESDENSNIFLYIDMHGHASKKGVFMYGNHLPNLSEAVECMLLPRLMSMNCHHFHFDACNFSERNMYYKGKKDGLSKEGSGRVAIYKAIGLIKSYTLECNYNTGKCVNILPPRNKETSIKMINLVPPKYTPAIFEEVGRALGPSILDLTNSNPISRVNNSDFRTLQGIKNSLHHEVKKNFLRASVNGKTTKTKCRRLKHSVVSSTTPLEVHKENKSFLNVAWDVKPSVSSHVVNTSITQRASKSVSGKVGGVLPVSVKQQKKIISKNSQPRTFGKKDSSGKKTKVLCDTSVGITKFQDSAIKGIVKDPPFQVPRKRIKVSAPVNTKSSMGIESSLSHDSYTSCYADNPPPSVANMFSINDDRTYLKDIYGKSLCMPSCGSSSLPNFYTAPINDGHFVDTVSSSSLQTHGRIKSDVKSLKSNSVLDINNMTGENKNVPCCSSTLKRNVMPLISKTTKTNSFITNLSVSNQSLSSNIKKTKFSKSATKQSTKLLKNSSSGELNKLKKKRIIKSDISIKRKKNRIKTTWH